jgi:hypothetical protein
MAEKTSVVRITSKNQHARVGDYGMHKEQDVYLVCLPHPYSDDDNRFCSV